MNKNGRIFKILAVIAGICASTPQVGAVPPKMGDKNDVKFNVKGNMNQSNVEGKKPGTKVGGVRRSKSMRPLSRSMELKSHGSLAQDVRSTDPKIEVLKGKETFWRYSNGKVKLCKAIGIPVGTLVGTILFIGGTYYVIDIIKWLNSKDYNDDPLGKKDDDVKNLNIDEIQNTKTNNEDNIENLNIDKIKKEKENETNKEDNEDTNNDNMNDNMNGKFVN